MLPRSGSFISKIFEDIKRRSRPWTARKFDKKDKSGVHRFKKYLIKMIKYFINGTINFYFFLLKYGTNVTPHFSGVR